MKKISSLFSLLVNIVTFLLFLFDVHELEAQCTFPHDLVSIPGSTFQMGTTAEQVGCSNETVHTVTISDFLLGAAEVTQGEWMSLMFDINTTGSPEFTACGDTCPMEKISWYDAIVYCNRLSELDLLQPCYFSDAAFTEVYGKSGGVWSLPNSGVVYWKLGSSGYRLPTESEWEYAARGGSSPQYIYSGDNNLDTVGWHDSNSYVSYSPNVGGRGTHPVKQKQPNDLDLYDMSGNVWEWCWDYHSAYPVGPLVDPTGDPDSTYRIERGGGWNDIPCYNSVSSRGLETNIHGRAFNLGFRLCKGSFIVDAGPDISICYGESADLVATGGSSYEWSNGLGSLDSVTTPALTTNTNYVVTVTLGTCTATDETSVNVAALVAPPGIIGDSICISGQANLSATGCSGGVINWYDSPDASSLVNTGNLYSPTISTTTTFYVECLLGSCTSTLTPVSVEVYPSPPSPVLTVSTPSQSICDGQSVTITAMPFSVIYLYEFFLNGISVQGPSPMNTYTLVPGVGEQNISAIITYAF